MQEFCAGLGARRAARSFFAVGDDKQSIFSFQGAAPDKFDSMRRVLTRRFVAVEQRFEYVQLTQSFARRPAVLSAVDAVFNFAGNSEGLTCDPDPNRPPLTHESTNAARACARGNLGADRPDRQGGARGLRLPLDYAKATDPGERLARKITAKIKSLLAPGSGEYVEDRFGRARSSRATFSSWCASAGAFSRR